MKLSRLNLDLSIVITFLIFKKCFTKREGYISVKLLNSYRESTTMPSHPAPYGNRKQFLFIKMKTALFKSLFKLVQILFS